MHIRPAAIFPFILIPLVVIAAYLPAISRGGFVWDDDAHLTENPAIVSPDGLTDIWNPAHATGRIQFYPVTFTSFWLQYRLNGFTPFWYHLVNVLFHATNAVLLWLILRRLGFTAALWTALLFALHPMNVESVAWVTERKNVLMAFFYLLAAASYLKFEGVLRPGDAGFVADEKRDWRFFALAVLAFFAALLSKTVACTFPAGIAVILWYKRGRLSLRAIAPLFPLLVIGLSMGVYTAHTEKNLVGSVGEAWHYNLVERFLIAGHAFWFYLAKLAWPTNLAFSYPLWKIDASDSTQYLYPLAAGLFMAFLWIGRKRFGLAPLAAVLFFFVTISPALGFFDYYTMIYSLAADHYVYIAEIGIFALIAESLWRRAQRRPRQVNSWMAASALPLLVLAALTWHRAGVFENSNTLWQDTLEKNPRSWIAHTIMGIENRRAGHLPEALAHLHEALAIKPDCFQALNSIGGVLIDLGRPADAEAYFQHVIKIAPTQAIGYANLATLRVLQKRDAEAAPLYEKAIALDPLHRPTLMNYGNFLASHGLFAQAIPIFQRAVDLQPADAQAHQLLARSLASAGRLPEALPHFEEAARLRPNDREAQQDLAQARAMLHSR